LTDTDALIIGAGPVGLYQAFQLGLLGLRVHLVDALPHVGGQCAELYPDKPLYDIPGLAVCTGQELVAALALQLRPFAPTLHLGQLVQRVARQPDHRWQVSTNQGQSIVARVVVIAAGIGAFVPRALKVEGADTLVGKQLFYQLDSLATYAGQHVVVVGGDELALSWVMRLAGQPPEHRPRHISLLHRRAVLTAPADLLRQFDALCQAGRTSLVVGQPTRLTPATGTQAGSLEIAAPEGSPGALAADAVLAATGLSPQLGPLAGWGLALERKQLVVDPATCATDQPGVFAVGDINTYPGKKKLIVCGFHESVMAAYAAAAIVHPDVAQPLLYTTTSTLLHQRLGVAH
jgi:thioredoxin reductase (NADPH)